MWTGARPTSCSRSPSQPIVTPTRRCTRSSSATFAGPNHRSRPVRRRPVRGRQPQMVGAGRGGTRLRGAQRLQVRPERPGQHHHPDASARAQGAGHERRPGAAGVHVRVLCLERQPGGERRRARSVRPQPSRRHRRTAPPGRSRFSRWMPRRSSSSPSSRPRTARATSSSASTNPSASPPRARCPRRLPVKRAWATDMLEESDRQAAAARERRPAGVPAVRDQDGAAGVVTDEV